MKHNERLSSALSLAIQKISLFQLSRARMECVERAGLAPSAFLSGQVEHDRIVCRAALTVALEEITGEQVNVRISA